MKLRFDKHQSLAFSCGTGGSGIDGSLPMYSCQVDRLNLGVVHAIRLNLHFIEFGTTTVLIGFIVKFTWSLDLTGDLEFSHLK